MLKRAVNHAIHGDGKRQRSMPGAGMVEKTGSAVPADGLRLQAGGNRKQQKVTKAANRIAQHGNQRLPAPKDIHTRTFLEEKTITIPRMKSYEVAWERLTHFAKQQKYPMSTLEQVDAAAAWWMDVLFFEGEGVSGAMTMMAAIKHMRTDVPRLNALVRCSRALRSFRRLAPPQARVPIPYPMLAQMIMHIVSQLNQPMVGVHLALTWSLCCRPGESLKLKYRQLVAPNQVSRRWSVILSESSPIEGKSQPSKTHELDEAVMIDHPYMQWLGVVLKHLKSKASSSQSVFDFDMAHVTKHWHLAADACGFHPHGIQCVYQIRHGSASTDRLTQQRSVEELMKRGRWKSLSRVGGSPRSLAASVQCSKKQPSRQKSSCPVLWPVALDAQSSQTQHLP